MKTMLLALTALTAVTVGSSASAATITDANATSRTFRSAGSAPVSLIQVTSSQTINAFGLDVDLNSPGNLQFTIFNNQNGNVLYQSAYKAFADTGPGYKLSDAFNFTFLPGITYGLTAQSSVDANYGYSLGAFTNGAFTFLGTNSNIGGAFGSPSYSANSGGGNISAAIVTAAVPEPATWALMILGMGAVGFAMRRRKNANTNVTVRFA